MLIINALMKSMIINLPSVVRLSVTGKLLRYRSHFYHSVQIFVALCHIKLITLHISNICARLPKINACLLKIKLPGQ